MPTAGPQSSSPTITRRRSARTTRSSATGVSLDRQAWQTRRSLPDSSNLEAMLDLAFVRANLPLVEEKLRSRGQDPAALLGDFHAIDARRRERITEAEQLKAQRN